MAVVEPSEVPQAQFSQHSQREQTIILLQRQAISSKQTWSVVAMTESAPDGERQNARRDNSSVEGIERSVK